jgi:hypothetical protein
MLATFIFAREITVTAVHSIALLQTFSVSRIRRSASAPGRKFCSPPASYRGKGVGGWGPGARGRLKHHVCGRRAVFLRIRTYRPAPEGIANVSKTGSGHQYTSRPTASCSCGASTAAPVVAALSPRLIQAGSAAAPRPASLPGEAPQVARQVRDSGRRGTATTVERGGPAPRPGSRAACARRPLPSFVTSRPLILPPRTLRLRMISHAAGYCLLLTLVRLHRARSDAKTNAHRVQPASSLAQTPRRASRCTSIVRFNRLAASSTRPAFPQAAPPPGNRQPSVFATAPVARVRAGSLS